MTSKREKLKYSIVFVEDDPQQIEEMNIHVKRHGNLELIGVTDRATEGYHLVKSHKPDILVVDIHLKEGDGLELIRKIREDKSLEGLMPYIVVVTANKSPIIKNVVMNLADFIYSKNADYQTSVLFQHLLFICANVDKQSAWTSSLDSKDFLDAKESHIRASVDRELNQYTFDVLKNPSKIFMHEVLYETVQVPQTENVKLSSVYKTIKERFELPKESGRSRIETMSQRFISDIFEKTDPKVLRELYPSYSCITPTTKEFVVYLSNKIKKDNGYDW